MGKAKKTTGGSTTESLEEELRRKENTGEVTKTKLKTDDRVLARVTDGIYRQPASALRELISNAYDADASYVRINTDAPRFENITISDDGNGLTRLALANLVEKIGGSLKRSRDGAKSGVTDPKNPDLSPVGRRLIGKIGIGLFAVAQLTRQFRIVTKRKGERFRRIADVTLRIYDDPESAAESSSGDVEIRTEKASDRDAHGTDITLLNIKPHTREILQSRGRWTKPEGAPDELVKWKPPAIHIGTSSLHEYPDSELVAERDDEPCVPWTMEDEPATRFKKLHQAVLDSAGKSKSDPGLEDIFDTYFQTIWTLALSAPIDYVQHDPFMLSESDDIHFYMLSNVKRGQSEKIEIPKGKTIGSAAKLDKRRATGFEVFVDDMQLLRPISFVDLPKSTKAAWTDPLMFVGKCKQDLSQFPEDASGGSQISFQAYFYWTPKVVPKEHNGVLLRINDASGTLFDETFMRYEIQEKYRLAQISAEIFFDKGLDSALNIDRESFNFSHPHFQFIAQWTHNALRQISNRHKQLLRDAQVQRNARDTAKKAGEIQRVVVESLEELGGYAPEIPTHTEIWHKVDDSIIANARKEGSLAYKAEDVLPPRYLSSKLSSGKKIERELLEKRAVAVAQVLDAYGLLEQLEYEDQETLIRTICRIFTTQES